MRARLVAMAKRPADRKLLISAKDTFALVDWLIPEDPEAVALTAAEEPPDAEAELPYRPPERHPEPSAEFVRSVGRQSDRRRPREGDDQRRRNSVVDAAIEVLSSSALPIAEATLLERVRERDLSGLELRRLRESLSSDNQQRLSSGRQPRFAVTAEGELRLTDEGDTSGTAVQQALVRQFGLSQQTTRPPEEQQPAEPVADAEATHRLKDLLKDARRASAEVMRARLAGLDAAVFERACVKLLHSLRYREIKGARRNREGRALTAKLRDGSLEIRCVIRVTVATVDRRMVQEVRRELESFGAQLGLILSPVHARGDVRSDALNGGKLVALWCGNGLGEKFLDAKVGVTTTSYELFELDPAFFEKAHADAAELAQRRQDRAQGEDIQAKDEAATPAAVPGEPTERTGRRRRRRRRGGQRTEAAPVGTETSGGTPDAASAAEGAGASESQTSTESSPEQFSNERRSFESAAPTFETASPVEASPVESRSDSRSDEPP